MRTGLGVAFASLLIANIAQAAPADAIRLAAGPGMTMPMPAGATPLVTMSMQPNLTNVTVKGSDGVAAGAVQSVVTSKDGRISLVNVGLSDSTKVVAINAEELGWDAAANALVSSLTAEQIRSLPPR